MTVTIVGAQLGDEGKGAVVDLFGDGADVVARYQGGDNAGHTVVHEGEEYKLSLVPSGAIRGKVGVLGNGTVVNPATLFEEIDELRERGVDPDVRVAERAHVILPYHRVIDGMEEDAKSDSDLDAGTTGRGIGPTYEDKAARRGLRIADLLYPDRLRRKLEYVVPIKRTFTAEVFGTDPGEEFDVDALFEEYREYGRRLREEEMTVNAGQFLAERIDAGDGVMLEGAQGTSIDIDHGDYPQVTSSNSTAGGACTGTGLGPTVVGEGEIVGVVKAYLTRVGSGPMPTELAGVEGDTPGYDGDAGAEEEQLATYIREAGGEYGTVTGRPRRVGWLDVPMLRHAARVSGFTGVVVNHVDVLGGLEEVRVGHRYDLDGSETATMPTSTEAWADAEVNYRTFDGWPEIDADEVDGYGDLPAAARTYLEYVEEQLGVPVYAVGVGPDREETVVRQRPW
ncbi:MAG: adenylosuccinate synthase [Halobacteriales archaeon]